MVKKKKKKTRRLGMAMSVSNCAFMLSHFWMKLIQRRLTDQEELLAMKFF